MKIYVSVDMEGLGGTYAWWQEDKNKNEVMKIFKYHIEWLVEAIKKSDKDSEIDEITIADSHSSGNNLTYDITFLDERINLISGSPRSQYMMPMFSKEYDTVFFIGYHAGKGRIRASMDHTYSGSCIHKLYINGEEMNETLINALYAGCFDVPVSLILGDFALKKEIENIMPWAEFIETKKAVSRFAAKSYSGEKIKKDIEIKVNKVLNNLDRFKPLKFEAPYELKAELATTAMADIVELMPSAERINGNTIRIVHNDYKVIFDALMAVVYLAYAGK